MNTFDLIVVGAGMVGVACADAACAEGLTVALIEPGPIGGGATAAAMGHLVAMDEDPAELALAACSLALWDEFPAPGAAEFNRCGTIWVARDDAELARVAPKIARLAAAGIRAEALDAKQLRELEPRLAPGLAGGMRVACEAVVYPPRAARWLVERARTRGLHWFAGRRVQTCSDGGVVLDDGTRLQGPVLLATGCALPALLPGLPVRPRKGHLVITDRHPGWTRHQLLELGYADSAHGNASSSVAFNVQPRPTGQLLIGSSREEGVTDAAVSLPIVQRMLARTLDYLPGLRAVRAIRIWTGFRPATPDGRPYLGAVPGTRNLWVAAGHEGLGITTALGSARLLMDLFLGRAPLIDPAPYSPARVAS